MELEVAQLWLAELRNPDRIKARGFLRTGDQCFCTLGVLADILDPNGWKREITGRFLWNGQSATLDPFVTMAQGLNARLMRHIVLLNDESPRTLPQIAQEIEPWLLR